MVCSLNLAALFSNTPVQCGHPQRPAWRKSTAEARPQRPVCTAVLPLGTPVSGCNTWSAGITHGLQTAPQPMPLR